MERQPGGTAADDAAAVQPFMCSFCLRPREQTGLLVGAPAVAICRGCTESALVLFEHAPADPNPSPRAPWDLLGDRELLARLPQIAKARDDVENHLRQWVAAARSRDISWAGIGEALGMSRQSAWERFHG
ncbi:ClpX C4-type zinc finger protein [Arthrobacter citreus]|uniref:ClpX C4-type zinc finger protein n=1 Tax=Arthrobacter TaxID=1663 RepID=UPI001265A5A6|nr:ClpX C4-type zinc finger protein [Arthrobacter gandavensis]